jgi:SAM-dependent methyltransferase
MQGIHKTKDEAMAKAKPKTKAASDKASIDNSHVAKQYEKWVYPFPIQDLSDPEVIRHRDGGDFERNFYTYWPDQEKREDLDVLVAGCGSNAAARYAFNHPEARVTGLDLSASSLAHEQYLKDKHNLKNLTLHQGRIEDIASFGKDYDFIDCSGVLHHLPDPVAGLKSLAGVLRPKGAMAIMVYGRYGRTGVYMMQEAFRLMGLEQSAEDLATVKHTISQLPKRHPIHEYMSRTRDTKYDAGLVDTFLHQQDRAYTVAECLDFAKQAGLNFINWWDNIFYYGEGQLNIQDALYQKVNAMPEKSIWQFMEVYNGTLGQHSFCLGHSTRPEKSYKVDFSGKDFMKYIPVLRCREVQPPQKLPEGNIAIQRQPYPVYTLGAAGAAVFRQIDGKKTIQECLKAAGVAAENPETVARAVFQYLWRLGYVFLRLPA